MKPVRFCAASNDCLKPRDQAHEHCGHKSRLKADLILLRGTDWPELDVTPAELPAEDQSQSNMIDRNQPATDAGRDYKVFVAARK